MWNQWKFIEKMTKDWNVSGFGNQKTLKSVDEARILHTFESSSSEHVNQKLMWNQWKPFEKITKLLQYTGSYRCVQVCTCAIVAVNLDTLTHLMRT